VAEGLLEVGLEIDPQPLGLWNNGRFRVSALYPHGKGASEKYAGDLLTVSNIDAFDSFRLWELWYEHHFMGEKLSLRFGQILADEEFTFTEAGGGFLNSAFGWPAFISANVINTGPAFFVAAPGARLRYEPTESFFIHAGVYDGDTFDDRDGDPHPTASGTRIHLSEDQGLYAMAEAGFRLNGGKENAGLPGVYKIGTWLHTGDFASNFDPDKTHSKNFGAYISAEQMICREEGDQGLWAFARAGVAPRDRSFFEFVTDFGLSCTGALPTRDEDVLGIGFVYARISRDIRRFERFDAEVNGTPYEAFSDHESVLEAFYSVQVNKWWTIQPDFQWIFNPGGTAAFSDAVVIGVRSAIVF
jgi:porin